MRSPEEINAETCEANEAVREAKRHKRKAKLLRRRNNWIDSLSKEHRSEVLNNEQPSLPA